MTKTSNTAVPEARANVEFVMQESVQRPPFVAVDLSTVSPLQTVMSTEEVIDSSTEEGEKPWDFHSAAVSLQMPFFWPLLLGSMICVTAVPLQDHHKGLQHQWGFWLQMMLDCLLFGVGTPVMGGLLIGLPPALDQCGLECFAVYSAGHLLLFPIFGAVRIWPVPFGVVTACGPVMVLAIALWAKRKAIPTLRAQYEQLAEQKGVALSDTVRHAIQQRAMWGGIWLVSVPVLIMTTTILVYGFRAAFALVPSWAQAAMAASYPALFWVCSKCVQKTVLKANSYLHPDLTFSALSFAPGEEPAEGQQLQKVSAPFNMAVPMDLALRTWFGVFSATFLISAKGLASSLIIVAGDVLGFVVIAALYVGAADRAMTALGFKAAEVEAQGANVVIQVVGLAGGQVLYLGLTPLMWWRNRAHAFTFENLDAEKLRASLYLAAVRLAVSMLVLALAVPPVLRRRGMTLKSALPRVLPGPLAAPLFALVTTLLLFTATLLQFKHWGADYTFEFAWLNDPPGGAS